MLPLTWHNLIGGNSTTSAQVQSAGTSSAGRRLAAPSACSAWWELLLDIHGTVPSPRFNQLLLQRAVVGEVYRLFRHIDTITKAAELYRKIWVYALFRIWDVVWVNSEMRDSLSGVWNTATKIKIAKQMK